MAFQPHSAIASYAARAAARRAEKLQAKHKFRYDLRILMQGRRKMGIGPYARILTDDFAPVNLYDSIKKSNAKKKQRAGRPTGFRPNSLPRCPHPFNNT